MQITTLIVGSLQTNCYLLTDETTRKTLIIDPGDEADFISTTILEKKLLPQAIILTHGHYDHCLGVLELKLNFNIPIYLHQADLFLYQNANQSSAFWSKNKNTPSSIYNLRSSLPPIDSHLTDNQTIIFGNSTLKVIHTPGHTPGSCCLLSLPTTIYDPSSTISLFTGDTLFATGPGSTEHKYSSKSDLQNSLLHLQSTIYNLPKLPLIYPGHEDYATPFPSNISSTTNDVQSTI